MLLLPERATRSMVMRAIALVAGFTALTAGVMAAMGTLGFETHAYLAMLAAETSAGASMNAASREVLPVVSQITSLDSIVGFWVTNPASRVLLTCAMLLGIGLLAIRQTRRVDTERGALLAVGMWCTLGMLATYHRAHDAVLLLLLVPWAVDRVRRTPLAWHAWAAAALYFAMSVSLRLSCGGALGGCRARAFNDRVCPTATGWVGGCAAAGGPAAGNEAGTGPRPRPQYAAS